MNITWISACPVVNPITVYSFGFLFNCTTVGQASDSMRPWRKALIRELLHDACLWLGPPWFNFVVVVFCTDYL